MKKENETMQKKVCVCVFDLVRVFSVSRQRKERFLHVRVRFLFHLRVSQLRFTHCIMSAAPSSALDQRLVEFSVLPANNGVKAFVGYDAVKEAFVSRVLAPIQRLRDGATALNSTAHALVPSVMIFGCVGSGMTLLSRHAAETLAEMGRHNGGTVLAARMNVTTVALAGRERDPANIVAAVFAQLRAHCAAAQSHAAVLVIDDMHDVFSEPTTDIASDGMLSQLIIEMNASTNVNARVLVVGNTHAPERINPALVHHFALKFHLPLPSVRSIAALMRHELKLEEQERANSVEPLLPDVDLRCVARRMSGRYTNADVLVVIKEAVMMPLREVMAEVMAQQPFVLRAVSVQDLLAAAMKTPPSVSPADVARSLAFARQHCAIDTLALEQQM